MASGPALYFPHFFVHADQRKSMNMHGSASGLGVQHGRRLVRIRLPFNHLNRLTMHFLSIGFCRQTNKQRMTTFFTNNDKQRKKGSKRIQMIIKTVTKFKLTVANFARPNQMQTCACTWIYHRKKKLSKIRTGPPSIVGRWAVVGWVPLHRPLGG